MIAAASLNRLAVAVALVGACGIEMHPRPDSGIPSVDPEEPPAGPVGSGGVSGTGGRSGAGGAAATGGVSGSGGRANRAGGAGGRSPSGGTGGRRRGSGGAPAAGGSSGSGGGPGPSVDMAPPPATPPVTPPASPPTTTAGPIIGGTMVPKERAVVFLHVGHSDMAGRATGPSSLRSFVSDPSPNLWVYQKGGSFRPAREPTAGDSGSAGKAGPGMAILRTALARGPGVHYISIGHGHSGATGGYCPNFRKGGLFWGLFMDAARELKGKVTFGALFTMFGITEYHLGTAGLMRLADCLTGLANEVRAELDAPSMVLMVGDWNMGGSGIYGPNSDYGKIARPQIQMVPMRDMRAAIIPTEGLPMEDDRHLNMEGQKVWAERAFAIMADKGWLTWVK